MACELRLPPSADAPWCIFFVYYKHLFNWVEVWGKQIFSNVYAPKKIIKMFAEYEGKSVCVTSLGQKWADGHMTVNGRTKWDLQEEEMALQRNHPLIWTLINILLVRSLFIWSSAVNHLVQGSEWRQDATFVGLHHLSVLDHLVQDDVDSIQVEHDLSAGLSRMRMNARRKLNTDFTATMEGYVQFALRTEEMESNGKLGRVMRLFWSRCTHHTAEVFI